MSDVIKKNTNTLTLKNPSSTSLTKIIKDKLDVDINNIKGSDIPKLFNKGLKFKGILGKKIIDSISNYLKKNPNTIKRYQKYLPDTLKKTRTDKFPVSITPKKIREIKKIDISNIMKNPRTARGQNLPTRITDKNKKTGNNITKRVIEGEVLQGIKKPKNGPKVNPQTIEGQFKNITSKPKRIGNIKTSNLNVKGIRPKAVVDALDDFPKFKPKPAYAPELDKKTKKDFNPKIKTPKTPKVIKKELPKVKSNDYTGRFIDKEGNVAYDSFSDFLAHMTGKPKKRAMPKKTARIIGTGNKLKRKEADTKGAGKGVKFKAFKAGTKDKTVATPMSPKDALKKKFAEATDMNFLMNTLGLKKPTRKRTMVEKIFGGGPDEAYTLKKGRAKITAKNQARKDLKKQYPELMKRVTNKSGGGLIAGLYDKPEKAETYKGNTSSARQVKGYGKARKRP